jgi:DNA polymerase III subunit gamma/tau
VRFAPVSGRFKVYIIDEVHMLSRHAFNALLKTLEEPPPSVKFIFATTDIHKVPVTILSRCQRFDLPRVTSTLLDSHLQKIARLEAVDIEQTATKLLARAAAGSVRDGLSLLDQAIALNYPQAVTANSVAEMLGLMDNVHALSLMAALTKGDIQQALSFAHAHYSRGGEPLTLLEELLGIIHALSLLKVDSQPDVLPDQLSILQGLLPALDIPKLTRLWQLALKGGEEIRQATNPLSALEMILIRLCYIHDMPSFSELKGGIVPINSRDMVAEPIAQVVSSKRLLPQTIHDIVSLLDDAREGQLSFAVKNAMVIEQIRETTLRVGLKEGTPKTLLLGLKKVLDTHTGAVWSVEEIETPQGTTLAENEREQALSQDTVQAAMELFKGSHVVAVE